MSFFAQIVDGVINSPSYDIKGQIGGDGGFRLTGARGSYEFQLQGKAKSGTSVEGNGITVNKFGGGSSFGQGSCTLVMQQVVPGPASIQARELARTKGPSVAGTPEQQAAAVLDFVAKHKDAPNSSPAAAPGTAQAPLTLEEQLKLIASARPSAPAQAATQPAPSVQGPVDTAASAAAPSSATPPNVAPSHAAIPAPAVASTCALPVAPIRPISAGKGTTFEAKPKLYVLSVGVSRYAEASMNLDYAAKDACDMARALAAQQGGLYRQVEIRVVQDEHATRDGVLDGLDWIVRETTARDVAMVFLAGHGVNDATGEYFFLPHDANFDRLARSAIPQGDIRRSLMQVPGKALFFFDTCHSGQIMASRRALPPDVSRFVEALTTAENSVVVFSASTGRQFAIEDRNWGNGAFTKALLEALGGRADYRKDRVITINELDLYLSERVKELTGGRQAPTTAKPASTQDFPIAVVR